MYSDTFIEKTLENVRKTGWLCDMPTNTCVGYCGAVFTKGCPLCGTKISVDEAKVKLGISEKEPE